MQQLQEEDQALQQESMEAQQAVMELKETLGAQLMQEKEADLNDEVQQLITDYLENITKTTTTPLCWLKEQVQVYCWQMMH